MSTLSIYLFMHSYALQKIFFGNLEFFWRERFPPDVPGINTVQAHTLPPVRQPSFNPVTHQTINTMGLQFCYKSFMWNFVESISEIKVNGIHVVFGIDISSNLF